MDTEKLTGFERISGKNGLFPPVLPISPAFSFPVYHHLSGGGVIIVFILFVHLFNFGQCVEICGNML